MLGLKLNHVNKRGHWSWDDYCCQQRNCNCSCKTMYNYEANIWISNETNKNIISSKVIKDGNFGIRTQSSSIFTPEICDSWPGNHINTQTLSQYWPRILPMRPRNHFASVNELIERMRTTSMEDVCT